METPYSADDIEPISYRESVRRRPGMYIGGTGAAGKGHLILELVGNSFDLALHGAVNSISVVLHENGSVEVGDDGPGIDLADPKVRGWFADGHRRPTADGHEPHMHVADWGVGAAVVNFLSSTFTLISWADGKRVECGWRAGGAEGGEVVPSADRGRGTVVRFVPDEQIFDESPIPVEALGARLKELACLHPGLLTSIGGESWSVGRWEDGMSALATAENVRAAAASGAWRDGGDGIDFRILLCDASDESGGADHAVYANYRCMDEHGPFHKRLSLDIDSLFGGHGDLVAVISVRMLRPDIGGPARSRLDDERAADALSLFLKHNQTAILEQIAQD